MRGGGRVAAYAAFLSIAAAAAAAAGLLLTAAHKECLLAKVLLGYLSRPRCLSHRAAMLCSN